MIRRLRVAPLLMLLLTAWPLAAATFEHPPREVWQPRLSITGLLSEAWALVSRVWEKAGGGIDPFGKAGGSIDPFGKEGSEIDPFGNPKPNTAQPPSPAESHSASGN